MVLNLIAASNSSNKAKMQSLGQSGWLAQIWGASFRTLRISVMTYAFSAAVAYCAPVWIRCAHTRQAASAVRYPSRSAPIPVRDPGPSRKHLQTATPSSCSTIITSYMMSSWRKKLLTDGAQENLCAHSRGTWKLVVQNQLCLRGSLHTREPGHLTLGSNFPRKPW